ncbi:MAG: hypothetical protein C0466_17495 [Candidatus Accumulibacter sp.]|nr:hypothetical protein [Accumulibacter sp.]
MPRVSRRPRRWRWPPRLSRRRRVRRPARLCAARSTRPYRRRAPPICAPLSWSVPKRPSNPPSPAWRPSPPHRS